MGRYRFGVSQSQIAFWGIRKADTWSSNASYSMTYQRSTFQFFLAMVHEPNYYTSSHNHAFIPLFFLSLLPPLQLLILDSGSSAFPDLPETVSLHTTPPLPLHSSPRSNAVQKRHLLRLPLRPLLPLPLQLLKVLLVGVITVRVHVLLAGAGELGVPVVLAFLFGAELLLLGALVGFALVGVVWGVG